MQMTIRQHADTSIVHVSGDFLSEPDQDRFRNRIREIVRQGAKEIIIDLSGVQHVNSCGLGALICSLTTVKRAQGDLSLSGINPDIRELLTMTKLDMIFQMYPTTEAALSALHVHPN